MPTIAPNPNMTPMVAPPPSLQGNDQYQQMQQMIEQQKQAQLMQKMQQIQQQQLARGRQAQQLQKTQGVPDAAVQKQLERQAYLKKMQERQNQIHQAQAQQKLLAAQKNKPIKTVNAAPVATSEVGSLKPRQTFSVGPNPKMTPTSPLIDVAMGGQPSGPAIGGGSMMPTGGGMWGQAPSPGGATGSTNQNQQQPNMWGM